MRSLLKDLLKTKIGYLISSVTLQKSLSFYEFSTLSSYNKMSLNYFDHVLAYSSEDRRVTPGSRYLYLARISIDKGYGKLLYNPQVDYGELFSVFRWIFERFGDNKDRFLLFIEHVLRKISVKPLEEQNEYIIIVKWLLGDPEKNPKRIFGRLGPPIFLEFSKNFLEALLGHFDLSLPYFRRRNFYPELLSDLVYSWTFNLDNFISPDPEKFLELLRKVENVSVFLRGGLEWDQSKINHKIEVFGQYLLLLRAYGLEDAQALALASLRS